MPLDQQLHEVGADRLHPGHVALDRRDLAVVAERPEGLGAAPGGGGVRAVAAVEQHEARGEVLVAQVGVELGRSSRARPAPCRRPCGSRGSPSRSRRRSRRPAPRRGPGAGGSGRRASRPRSAPRGGGRGPGAPRGRCAGPPRPGAARPASTGTSAQPSTSASASAASSSTRFTQRRRGTASKGRKNMPSATSRCAIRRTWSGKRSSSSGQGMSRSRPGAVARRAAVVELPAQVEGDLDEPALGDPLAGGEEAHPARVLCLVPRPPDACFRFHDRVKQGAYDLAAPGSMIAGTKPRHRAHRRRSCAGSGRAERRRRAPGRPKRATGP